MSKMAVEQRIKCEATNRLYLVFEEAGIRAWCVHCKKPHLYPREQAIAMLLGASSGESTHKQVECDRIAQ